MQDFVELPGSIELDLLKVVNYLTVIHKVGTMFDKLADGVTDSAHHA